MFGSSIFSRASLGGMLILTSLFSFAIFGTADAATTIELGRVDLYEEGQAEMPILFYSDNPEFQFDEFHITLRYDTAYLAFDEAQPGELLTQNSWENFSFEEQSEGIISITASSGSGNTIGSAAVGDLVLLDFWLTPPARQDCRPFFVEFFWDDCDDNLFIDVNSSTAHIESEVYHWGGCYFYQREESLPTPAGTPDNCLPELSGYSSIARDIKFYGQPVLYMCPESWTRGDIDCDGYPMQPGDYLLYPLYFYYGPTVFTVNLAAQIANTDINNDGRVLTVADWISMYRLMVGHVYMDKNDAKDSMDFIQDTFDKKVYCRSRDTATFVELQFDKIVDITAFNENITAVPLRPEDRSLVPLVAYNFEVYSGITDGWLFSYTGDPILQTVSTGQIEYMESAGCGDANHDKSINVSDAVFIINYVFVGLTDPFIKYLGDANCDGSINVSDAVYLINFIFVGGPAPGSECQ